MLKDIRNALSYQNAIPWCPMTSFLVIQRRCDHLFLFPRACVYPIVQITNYAFSWSMSWSVSWDRLDWMMRAKLGLRLRWIESFMLVVRLIPLDKSRVTREHFHASSKSTSILHSELNLTVKWMSQAIHNAQKKLFNVVFYRRKCVTRCGEL